MAATVTLASTTLVNQVDPSATEVRLASAAGVLPGMNLWMGGELMQVQPQPAGSNPVKVSRGVGGTAALSQASGNTVYIGQPEQFYSSDPKGAPALSIAVSPWINALNGKVWFAQGDDTEGQQNARWWQEVTTVYGFTSLGVRTQDSAPTSST